MSEQTKTNELNDVERYILSTIRNIQFGSVEVTIHDANIVQVEKSEKKRFDKHSS
jgi:hypothetical protein